MVDIGDPPVSQELRPRLLLEWRIVKVGLQPSCTCFDPGCRVQMSPDTELPLTSTLHLHDSDSS